MGVFDQVEKIQDWTTCAFLLLGGSARDITIAMEYPVLLVSALLSRFHVNVGASTIDKHWHCTVLDDPRNSSSNHTRFEIVRSSGAARR